MTALHQPHIQIKASEERDLTDPAFWPPYRRPQSLSKREKRGQIDADPGRLSGAGLRLHLRRLATVLGFRARYQSASAGIWRTGTRTMSAKTAGPPQRNCASAAVKVFLTGSSWNSFLATAMAGPRWQASKSWKKTEDTVEARCADTGSADGWSGGSREEKKLRLRYVASVRRPFFFPLF